ncbi:MAG: hypothetical protein JHC95_10085 [Solirubrobacteraceae bacterium]|nr:hypothetical protein [Solirubrobacteraceae bacterium]
MRKVIVLSSAAVIAATASIAVPALAATKSINVGDNYFVRSSGVPTVTVSKGTTVKWKFVGDSPHNVTVTGGPARFSSPTKDSGSYTKKVTKKGLYTIVCTIHGASDQSMKLRVK